MIGKVSRGSDTAGLLRYLYGPGRANEHTDPHLVASWLGDGRQVLDHLEPAAAPAPRRFQPLADRLNLPLQLLPDLPDRYVWQCSMRLADGDCRLSDAEWAQVAREVVERTGFAPAGDPGGCRWVAVRHADDHIHVVVTLGRQDGRPVNTFRDWPKVHAAARAAERRFGLTTVPSPRRSGRVSPTRGEIEKAARLGTRDTSRAWLARRVRLAAMSSTNPRDFERLLRQHPDLVLSWRHSVRDPGTVTGYRVGRRGDVDSRGQQVWFGGSKLSVDLSLPRLRSRWDGLHSQPEYVRPTPRFQLSRGPQLLALDVADLSRVLPRQAADAVQIATDLIRLGALSHHRADARRLLGLRATLPHRAAGPVQPSDVACLRAALPRELAIRIEAEPEWPALAAQLRRIAREGGSPVRALVDAREERELTSALSAAAVLQHRLVRSTVNRTQTARHHPSPRPGDQRGNARPR